jgi:hypothetical protein
VTWVFAWESRIQHQRRGTMTTIRLVLLHVALVPFALACTSSDRAIATATSQDSIAEAVIYAGGGGGATVGMFYDIRLRPAISAEHGLNIFDGYALSCVDVRWEDKQTLVIRYNDSTGQAALTRGTLVPLSVGDSSTVIHVRLEHAPNFERGPGPGMTCFPNRS